MNADDKLLVGKKYSIKENKPILYAQQTLLHTVTCIGTGLWDK